MTQIVTTQRASTVNVPAVPKNSKLPKELIIKALAEIKIVMAMKYMGNLEVSWFGIVEKTDTAFILEDVIFPPQENQPTYVTTKDADFPTWFFENVTKNDLNFKTRLHGHTHPSFAASPSGTDLEQFRTFSKEVPDYMIQMILNNNRGEYCRMWDMEFDEQFDMTTTWELSKSINTQLESVVHKVTPVYTPAYYGSHYGDYGYGGYSRRSMWDDDYDDNDRYYNKNKKGKGKTNGPSKTRSILQSNLCNPTSTYNWLRSPW